MMDYPGYYKPLFTSKDFTLDGLTIVLSTRAHDIRGALSNVEFSSINLSGSLTNGYSLSFDVYKTLNGKEEALWDEIIDHKLIYVPELEDFLEITITDNDSIAQKKSVSAVSAGIAELSQTTLYSFEANTEDDIKRDDYVVTKFYDPNNTKGSLLHRLLEKVPQYSLGYVSDSLKNLQRTIKVDGKDVWSALTEDVSKAFNCMFLVDSVEKKLYAYDLEIFCEDCHERFEYKSEDDIGTCPKCGGHNLTYFGEDSTFYVDRENLTDGITVTVNADSIKNTMRLKAGDDLMTATVRSLNPNGTDYITQFNEETLKDMPADLVSKIRDYQVLYKEKLPAYQQTMQDLYNAYDWQLYYQSHMMPGAEDPDGTKHGVSPDRGTITAASEAAKLNPTNLSTVGIAGFSSSTSSATIDAAVLNYARTIVKAGYVRLEISGTSTQTNNGSSGTWKGVFKVTNYSTLSEKEEKQDIAYSEPLTVNINGNFKTYLDQYLYKSIKRQAEDEEDNIYDILKIKDDKNFQDAIKYYGLNRLISFRDAYENCIAILSGEAGSKNAKVYNSVYGEKAFQEQIYDPYVVRLHMVQAELDARASTVNEWTQKVDTLTQTKIGIQKELDFRAFLGEALYKTYCAYRREDTYENSNYISEGLDNAALFKKAQEYLDAAHKQLDIAATPQYTVKLDLYALLHKPEYQQLAPYFLPGNWIHVRADGKLFRLRLTEFGINFGDPTKISAVFSNVTVTGSIVSDVKSILDSAKSMATTYNYTAQQASLGEDSFNKQKAFFQSGLVSAANRLKTNTDETITWGKFGILARQYDDITNDYNDEQLQLTHNVLAFTSDGWKTASAAIGKQTYNTYDEDKKQFVEKEGYGVNAQFMQAGQINGVQITGSKLFSSAVVSDGNGHETPVSSIDLDTGEFSLGNGTLTFKKPTNGDGILEIKGNAHFTGDISGSTGTFSGSITSTDGTIGGIKISSNGLSAGNDYVHKDGEFSLGGGKISYKNGTLKVQGDITGSTGTFSGNLSGATGTFSGSLSGASITGATGVFSGALNASAGYIGGLCIDQSGIYTTNGFMRLFNDSFIAAESNSVIKIKEGLSTALQSVGKQVGYIGTAKFYTQGSTCSYADAAGEAYSIKGDRVIGTVSQASTATYADTAGSVSGTVADASYASNAGTASYATTAGSVISVSGSSVSGYVANATHASNADKAGGRSLVAIYSWYNSAAKDHMYGPSNLYPAGYSRESVVFYALQA